MSAERSAGRPEVLRSVSEWAAQELVVALSLATEAAEALLELLPRARAPTAGHARGARGRSAAPRPPLADARQGRRRSRTRPFGPRWKQRCCAGRRDGSPPLRNSVPRRVARCSRRDARAAARNLEKAIRKRGVHLRPEATDGMAAVTALLTLPEAKFAGPRTRGLRRRHPRRPRRSAELAKQKMADCLLDLVLRPGKADAPSVQLILTVVASISTLTGGDEPGGDRRSRRAGRNGPRSARPVVRTAGGPARRG